MKFNINDQIKIKLTDKGRIILKKLHEESLFVESHMYNVQEDKEGYSIWQLWFLMQCFGEYINFNLPLPFETEIEIIEN